MAYRVLIVDDSPAMRTFVRRVVEISGFDLVACFEAEHGQAALDLVRAQWVDAILTDINMPVMDGEELLHQLTRDEMLRSIPVLVVSTDATDARIQRLLSSGASGYVTKPFVPEQLRAALEAILRHPHD